MTTKFRSVCVECDWTSGHADGIGDPAAPGWFSWDDENQPDTCPECSDETFSESSDDCFREIANRGSVKDNPFVDDLEDEMTDREKELARLIELQENLIAVITDPVKLIIARVVLGKLVKEFNDI